MPSKSNKFNLAGGWTNPSEKYARQLGLIFPIFRDEHKKYLSCHHLVIKFGCKPLGSLLLRSRACRSHKVTVAMNQRVRKKWRAKRLWRVARSAAAAALRHHYVIIDRDSKHEKKETTQACWLVLASQLYLWNKVHGPMSACHIDPVVRKAPKKSPLSWSATDVPQTVNMLLG